MFDPVTLWMQSSLVWIKIFKQQQELYLRMLGSMAQTIPHETAADLSREAEALKKTLTSTRKPASAKGTPKAATADTSLVSA